MPKERRSMHLDLIGLPPLRGVEGPGRAQGTPPSIAPSPPRGCSCAANAGLINPRLICSALFATGKYNTIHEQRVSRYEGGLHRARLTYEQKRLPYNNTSFAKGSISRRW